MACDVLLGAGYTFTVGSDQAHPTDLLNNVEIAEGSISVDVQTITKQALDEEVPCVHVVSRTYTINISKWIATTYPLIPLSGETVYVTVKDNQLVPLTVFAGSCLATSGSISGVRVNEYVTEQMTFVSDGEPDYIGGVAQGA